MKRILALDVGEKRIGVAVSDPLGLTAQGVETIFSKGIARDHERIVQLLNIYETDRIVVGLPRSMNGSEGFQAERVREFMQGLIEWGYRVKWQDERLTSASATRTLLEGNVSRVKRKQVIDKLAATYILQGFLDAGGWKDDA